MKYFCMILFYFSSYCVAEKNYEFEMIGDVLKKFHTPQSVIIKGCWDDGERAILLSTLKDFRMQLELSSITRIHNPAIFIVDLRCPNITEYLRKSSNEKLFQSPSKWIVVGVDETDEEIDPNMFLTEDINILPNSEVAVAVGRKEAFDLIFIYKVSSGSPWIVETFGSWDRDKGFQTSDDIKQRSTAIRRLDLQGTVIPICFVVTNNDSRNHLSDRIDDHIDTITKANFPTTNFLIDFLNANKEYVFVDTWGYRVNGTWNGLTGYLMREEVEIGGSPMFFTTERVGIVEYIASPVPTRSKFVFQQPKLSYENNLFLLSFKTNVWYCSLALLFLIFIVLIIVAFWEWRRYQHDSIVLVNSMVVLQLILLFLLDQCKQEAGVLRASVPDVAILVLGATCQQGSPVELKGPLGRYVLLVLFLALMFLYTSYSANIVALLQSSSSKIQTLEDLLHSRLKFGVDDTVFNRYYFTTATEPTRKAIYNKKIAPPGSKPSFMSLEEGVKNMRKGLFAFHMEIGVGYKFVGKIFHEGEKCSLKEIQYLQVIDPWLAVTKHTPYKEMYKIGFKRIQEHGLQNRENLLHYEKRPKCTGHGANFVSVSMVDCYPAIMVLTYGVAVSLMLLLLEIIHSKREVVMEKLLRHAGDRFE